MVDKLKQKAGRLGAAVTHKTRWEIIKELSGLYDKKKLDWFMTKWRTRHLVELIRWIRESKKNV
ncbi:MAG: hypothetical protein AABY22_31490 [Nanoarchaeota archaeon]